MGSHQLKIIFCLLSLFTYFGEAQATVLEIKNDLSKEKEGRLIEVENIETSENPKSKYRLKIYPDEVKELAAGDVIEFSVNRVFSTHKIKYQVRCKKSTSDIAKTITLTEIHNDKIGEECHLIGYGHWSRRTGTSWIKRLDE